MNALVQDEGGCIRTGSSRERIDRPERTGEPLVHLYTLGEVREETLRNESAGIASQRMVLEEQLGSLRRQALPAVRNLDPERLNSICAAVAAWLEGAGEPEKDLVLEALQIGVTATVEETRVSGVLPTELPFFLADESEQEYSDFEVNSGIPFGRDLRSG